MKKVFIILLLLLFLLVVVGIYFFVGTTELTDEQILNLEDDCYKTTIHGELKTICKISNVQVSSGQIVSAEI